MTQTSGNNLHPNSQPDGGEFLASPKHTKIVFFGNERLATGVTTDLPVLRMLVDEGYDIVGIIVSDRVAKTRKIRPLEIEAFAQQYNIPVYRPERLSDLAEEISSWQAQIGVLVAYGKIVPEMIIHLFPHGILNIHPSALPKHRGSIPIESVILSGETETAVSLMDVVKKMDAGPVYAQAPFHLTGEETKQYLADTLGQLGAEMLRVVLPLIFSQNAIAISQADNAATYDMRIEKASQHLDLSKTATALEKEIRAYAGWPGSRINLEGLDVVVEAAQVISTPDNIEKNRTIYLFNRQLCIQTRSGSLVLTQVKPAGKNTMSGQAFLAGYGYLFPL